jgi:hypothetical protein
MSAAVQRRQHGRACTDENQGGTRPPRHAEAI